MSKCNIIVTDNFYKQIIAEVLMNLSEEGRKENPKPENVTWVG
jgi:hypothetical protein